MRNFLHVLVSLLMWCLFGYYWYVVLGREISESSIQALGVLSLVIAIGLILTFWWVAHNKRIARRNRRQGSPPTAPETFDQDTLERPLVSPGIEVLRQAQVVEVTVDDENRKVYTPVQEVGD